MAREKAWAPFGSPLRRERFAEGCGAPSPCPIFGWRTPAREACRMGGSPAPQPFVSLDDMLEGRRRHIICVDSARVRREFPSGEALLQALESAAGAARCMGASMRKFESPAAERAAELGLQAMYPAERARNFLDTRVSIMDGQGKLLHMAGSYWRAMLWLDAESEAERISKARAGAHAQGGSPALRRRQRRL